jgi:hypothetical protein
MSHELEDTHAHDPKLYRALLQTRLSLGRAGMDALSHDDLAKFAELSPQIDHVERLLGKFAKYRRSGRDAAALFDALRMHDPGAAALSAAPCRRCRDGKPIVSAS